MGRPKKNKANAEAVQTLERDETEEVLERHEPEPQPEPEEQSSVPKAPKVRKTERQKEETSEPINWPAKLDPNNRLAEYEEAQRLKAMAPPERQAPPDHYDDHFWISNLIYALLKGYRRGQIQNELAEQILSGVPVQGCVRCKNSLVTVYRKFRDKELTLSGPDTVLGNLSR